MQNMTQGSGNPESPMMETVKSAQGAFSQQAKKISSNVDKAMDATAVGLQRTSNRISQMASYFRDHNTSDVMGALENSIRKYPTRSILISLLVGFILNGLLRRR